MIAEHTERLGGIQLHHVMSRPEVLDIPRAPGRMEDLHGRSCRKFTVRRYGDIGPA